MRVRVTRSWRRTSVGLVVAGLALAGCESNILQDFGSFDPDADKSRTDYEEILEARPADEAIPPPPIPELQPIISTSPFGAEVESRRGTVTVTETTPLKDVLIELAREARVDLELDPPIQGGVIFSAYEKPFEQVMRRLADLAGLRYGINDGVLRIELDEPRHVNYKIGYLSIVRNASSQVATESSFVGGDDDGSGDSSGGGASSSTVDSTSKADFWAELETNITQILTNTAARRGLLMQAAAVPIGAAGEPAAAAPAAATQPGVQGSLEVLTMLMERKEAGTAVPGPAQPVAVATGGTLAAASATGIPTLQPSFREASSSFTINRQAGILSVFGTERQHVAIENYLSKVRTSVSAQVLIEAKILEVSLDDEFRFGVDWVSLFAGRTGFAAPFNIVSTAVLTSPPFGQLIAPIGGTVSTPNLLTLSTGGADLNLIARAVEEFGTVRALSSPRLTVMQNQTAVLKVTEEEVFFSQEVTPGSVTDAGTGAPTVTSVINTVTVGFIMTVQPSINLDTDEITLTLRPTITRVAAEVQDPSVVGVASLIPQLGVQEIDSVVTVSSGNVIVMGGLMQDRSTVDESGIPGLSDIPWIGSAFKSKNRNTEKSELVVFLRANIIRNDSVDPYDIDLYKLFGEDRRPLTF